MTNKLNFRLITIQIPYGFHLFFIQINSFSMINKSNLRYKMIYLIEKKCFCFCVLFLFKIIYLYLNMFFRFCFLFFFIVQKFKILKRSEHHWKSSALIVNVDEWDFRILNGKGSMFIDEIVYDNQMIYFCFCFSVCVCLLLLLGTRSYSRHWELGRKFDRTTRVR